MTPTVLVPDSVFVLVIVPCIIPLSDSQLWERPRPSMVLWLVKTVEWLLAALLLSNSDRTDNDFSILMLEKLV